MANNFNVFPIKGGAKFPPLVRGWQYAKKKREDWFGYDGSNWGVDCEGMIVVDVDVRSGGMDSLDLLGLPATYTVETPTGGLHLYFKLPEGHPGVNNSASKLAPGIDIKSTGGYVLAPGSQIDGREYQVISIDQPPAPAPDWLVQRLGVYTERERQPKVNVPDAPADRIEQAREWLQGRPQGDDAFATACGLRDFGLSQGQAMALLAAHDGRPVNVLESKVEHAYEYAQGKPGSKGISATEFDAVPAPPPAPKKGPTPFAELAAGGRTGKGYLVKGLLNRGSHAVVYGPPGAGKTFVALDMAYHVATGKPWMGRRTRQGTVLYLAYEGMGGLANRVQMLKQHYGTPDAPMYFLAADYNLREKAGRQALGEMIAELPEKPAMIVIDTLARAMRGGDENSAQDMGALNDAVAELIKATGACVVLIHHSGKNKTNGARGSSALLGALDTEIEIDENVIQATKQRDIEQGRPIGFKLVAEALMGEVDEDGDEIRSCYVVEAPVVKEVKLSRGAKTMLEKFKAAGKLMTEEELVPSRMTNERRDKAYDFLAELLDSGQIMAVEGGYALYG